ncbi:hypothetical protein JXM83_04275 [Candidatus Woesearchaeota archaeon]|nr:hypothetical protein [Candidatus Woesearchaeota archaeon]
MKKLISITMSLLLLLSFAFAANNESGSTDGDTIVEATMLDSRVPPPKPVDNLTAEDMMNMTPSERQAVMDKVLADKNLTKEDLAKMSGSGEMIRERIMDGSGNQTQTRERIQALKNEMQQMRTQMQTESQNLKAKKSEMLQKQNEVRMAVQSLQRLKDFLDPNMGAKVSEIAKGFNNSLKETVQAEEQIQSRGGLKRFFAGGDSAAAEKIKTQANQTQNRLQELKQLHESCDCDEEVKAMLQEQIQSMEQEQTRLRELADKEEKSKGLFGWLWK